MSLEDHTHCTKFRNFTSGMRSINASVIQGSAIGPVMFAVVAADLAPLKSFNALFKYADDMYLIVSRSCSCVD